MPKRPSNGVSGSASVDAGQPAPTTPLPEAAPVTVTAPGDGEVSKFQRFTTDTIHRSQIKNATYNPRQITEQAKKRLRDALNRVGLVQPIVWNRQSGNIVGGHQRIKQLDALEGGTDYRLTVAVLDVDEVREKELNVLLNNPEAQGDWDLKALKDLLDTDGLSLEHTGFGVADLMQMFGDAPMQDGAVQNELADQLSGVKGAYEKLANMSLNKDDSDFYCVVVFRSVDERTRFLEAMELPDNRYVNGDYLTDRLKLARAQLGAEEAEGTTEGNRGGEGGGVSQDKPVVAKKVG
jgi:hypothetical protein